MYRLSVFCHPPAVFRWWQAKKGAHKLTNKPYYTSFCCWWCCGSFSVLKLPLCPALLFFLLAGDRVGLYGKQKEKGWIMVFPVSSGKRNRQSERKTRAVEEEEEKESVSFFRLIFSRSCSSSGEKKRGSMEKKKPGIFQERKRRETCMPA